MVNVHGYRGYVIMSRKLVLTGTPESVLTNRKQPWQSQEPLVVYSSVDEVFAQNPALNPKTTFVGEVSLSLLAEVKKLYGPVMTTTDTSPETSSMLKTDQRSA